MLAVSIVDSPESSTSHITVSLVLHYSSQLIQILGPLYKTLGCFLAQVESPWQVTLLKSNVSKHLHENSSQAGSAALAG